ncbi:MAG: TonB-dependent receptor [Bacteroidota bacterium]
MTATTSKFFLLNMFLSFQFIAIGQTILSCDYNQVPLYQILTDLNENDNLIFSYTNDLPLHQNISLSFKNKNLEEALDLIFDLTLIQYEIVDKTYIVLTLKNAITICGKITDKNAYPLPYANVLLKSSNVGTTSNESGYFQWSGKVHIIDTVVISYIGYKILEIPLDDLFKCPTIELGLLNSHLSEVVIQEYLTQGIEQSFTLDHLILDPGKISPLPGINEADPMQTIQMLPGIQSIDESAMNINIRGGTPDQNLILWDGIPIYNNGHFFGMISAFDPSIIENIKVYKGDFNTQYGGRIAGVIDISGKTKVPKSIQSNIGLNLTHLNASLNIPFVRKKSALILSTRQSFPSAFNSPTYKKLSASVFQNGRIREQLELEELLDHINLNLNFKYRDAHAKWLFNPNDKTSLSISTFGMIDQLNASMVDEMENSLEQDEFDIYNYGVGTEWSQQWNKRWNTTSNLTYTKYRNDFTNKIGEFEKLETQQALLNSIDDLTFRIHHTIQLSSLFNFNWGYQFSQLDVKSNVLRLGEESSENLPQQAAIHSTYGSIRPSLGKRWQINLGLRFNADALNNYNWLEPRGTVFYIPHTHLQFKYSLGLYQQVLHQILEMNDLRFNENIWILANREDRLPRSKSLNSTIGILYHKANFLLDIEAYYKNLTGITTASTAFINAEERPEFTHIGKGTVKGIDILIKNQFVKYTSWLSYTYNDINYQFDLLNKGQNFTAPQERPHSLTFVHALQLNNWQFSLVWNYASGLSYTSANGIEYDDDTINITYPDEGINTERLRVYHRLDGSITYQIKLKSKKSRGKIGLSILNVYNRKNLQDRRNVVDYNKVIGENYLLDINRNMLGITPNISISWSWK